MHGVALLLTVAAIGVEYGWQPGEDGQLEYIIQIEPELVKTLSEGKVDLLSEIPEELQGVKRFRIRVGTGAVPRKGLENIQANAIQPGDNIANQPPNLNSGQYSQTDPRTFGARKPGDTRGSPTQQPGAKVLDPPGTDPIAPSPDDRFTGSTQGGNFPAVGQTPGINRNASIPRDRFGSTATDPTEPLNDRTSLGFDNTTTGTRTTGTNTTSQPVWDAATGQWRTPRATTGTNTGTNTGTGTGTGNNFGAGTNTGTGAAPLTNPNSQGTGTDPRGAQTQDPRYNNDPRYASDPRYQNDPRYTPYAPNSYPPNNYAPPANQGNAWGPQNYQAPQGYYPPSQYASGPAGQYDPNLPMNRQVGYQVAANTNPNSPSGTGATTATQPTAAGATTAATATKPTTAVSTRELDRYGDASKPWWPLTFTAMLLFASVGLNFYLGWIAHGIYQRYRALLMEVRNVRTATI